MKKIPQGIGKLKNDKACLVQASAQGLVTVKEVHIFTQVCGMEKCP